MTKKKFREDVRLAVELFGMNELTRELGVAPSAINGWLRGTTVPPPDSPIVNKLAFMLKE